MLLSNVALAHPDWPYTTDKIKPRYELRVKKRKERKIEEIINNLEHVPDKIQQICNDYGGKVIIFDGRITELEHMKHYKGQKPKGWELSWEHAPGTYYNKFKEVMIKQSYDEYGTNLELHEYGHMVDYALGKLMEEGRLSDIKEFIEIHEKYSNQKFLGIFNTMKPYEKNFRNEFFAESFAKYYYSKKTRKKLKKEYPEVYKFFKSLEGKIIKELNDFYIF